MAWYATKAPFFKFTVKFCAVLAVFYTLLGTSLTQRGLVSFAVGIARWSSGVLNVLGEQTSVTEATLWSSHFAVTVLPICTGVEFSMFFCATVIAFPGRVLCKIIGLLLGVSLLLGLNLLRVISLFYIGVHYGRFFDTAHQELWGILLIVVSVALTAIWIGWAQNSESSRSNVEA